ncbi:MAG: AGE family epimerase/isomerase [Acutalibacteraceae bacterium]
MEKEYLLETQKWVKEELERCLDFWLKNGEDKVNGGVYTCLDRKGEIYSTDKSVWMQGRCAWIFAHLCNVYGKNEQWLSFSRSCLDFMEEHCINKNAGRRMYFTVTADGKPLRQRRYCFSESFYCIANAEYYMATDEKIRLERAREAYHLIYGLNHGMKDPTGLGAKTVEETRKCRALADPMIFLNTTEIMRKADSENKDLYDKYSAQCVHDILSYHHKPLLGCTLETVGTDGKFLSDVSVGRVVNPGHDIECSWFLMQEANRTKNKELYDKALEIYRLAFEGGWDKEYGGLLYFRDCLGKPPEAYEHDMKLWWPHNEILIASLMAYRDTGDEYYIKNFKKTLDYCKTYFSDPQYGDWYGYLRRDGKPTEPACKGSTFKGPFHLPRMLIMLDQMIDEITAKNE